MINAYLGNFDGALTEEELDIICEKAKLNDIELFCESKNRGPINAAIDDMVSNVLIAFSSDIFSGLCNYITLISTVSYILKIIFKFVKHKRFRKFTVESNNEIKPNINIQIENITILNPKTDDANIEKYYGEAFIIAKEKYNNNQNNEDNIIIEYDLETQQAKSYTTVEYAYMKMDESKKENYE